MDRKQRLALEKQRMVDIYRSCRLCGAGGGYKMPIIQQILPSDVDVETELKDKIRECVSIAVSKEDKMPPLICELCVDKVNDFYEFREMCLQVNMRTRTKLGLPPQAMPSGSGDASDCILGLTSQVYVNPKEEDEEKVTPKSKGKSIPKITIKKEEKGWNKSVEGESPSTRSSRHSKPEVIDKPGPKSSKKLNRSKREPTPPALPDNKKSLLRSSRSMICTPSPTLKEKSTKRSLDKSVEAEPRSSKKLRFKAPSPSPPPTRAEKRRSVTFSPAPAVSPVTSKKTKQVTPDQRTDKKQDKVPEKRTERRFEKPIEKPSQKRHEKVAEKRNERVTEKRNERVTEKRNERVTEKRNERVTEKRNERVTEKRNERVTEKRIDKVVEKRPVLPTCNLCGQTYTAKKGDHRSHLIAHHSPTTTSERMSCVPCREWFATQDDASAHHKWHRSTGAAYKCAKCNTDHKAMAAFNRHILLGQCTEETVVPDVRCEQCWNNFATQNWMKLHKCGGIDARPGGNCSKCNKKFVRYKQQLKHEETCTGKARKRASGAHAEQVQPIQVRMERCDRLLQTIKIEPQDGATAGGANTKYDVSEVNPEFGYDKNCVYPYISSVGTLRLKTEDGYIMDGMKQEIMDEMYDTYDDDDFVDGYPSSDELMTTSVIINPFAVRNTKAVEKLSSISLRAVFSEKFLAYGNPPKRKRRKLQKSKPTYNKTSIMAGKGNTETPFDSLFETNDRGSEKASRDVSDRTEIPKCGTDDTNVSMSDVDETAVSESITNEREVSESAVGETANPESVVDETEKTDDAVDKTDATDGAVDKTDATYSAVEKTDAADSAVAETGATDSAVEKTDATDSSAEKTDELESAVDETDETDSAVDKTDETDSAVEKTDELESAVKKTGVTGSAVNDTDATDSAVEKTDELKSAVDETDGTDNAVDKTDKTDSAVDETDASKSTVEKTDEIENAVDETDTTKSAVDETDATESTVDNTDAAESAVHITDATESTVDIPDETESSVNTKEITECAVDATEKNVDTTESAANVTDTSESAMDEGGASIGAIDETEVSDSARDETEVSASVSDETGVSETAMDEAEVSESSSDATDLLKSKMDETAISEDNKDETDSSQEVTNDFKESESSTNERDVSKTVSVESEINTNEIHEKAEEKSYSDENMSTSDVENNDTDEFIEVKRNAMDTIDKSSEDNNSNDETVDKSSVSTENNDDGKIEEKSNELEIVKKNIIATVDDKITGDISNGEDNTDEITREIDRFLSDVSDSKNKGSGSMETEIDDAVSNTDDEINENSGEDVINEKKDVFMESEESERNLNETSLAADVLENELSLAGNDVVVDENAVSENEFKDIELESLIETSVLSNIAVEPKCDVSTEDSLGMSNVNTEDINNVAEEKLNVSDDLNGIQFAPLETRKVLDKSELIESNDSFSNESPMIHTDGNFKDVSGVSETLVSDMNESFDDFEVGKNAENIGENTDSNLDYGDEASLLKSPECDEDSSKSVENEVSVSKDNRLDENIPQSDERDDILELDNISDTEFDFE